MARFFSSLCVVLRLHNWEETFSEGASICASTFSRNSFHFQGFVTNHRISLCLSVFSNLETNEKSRISRYSKIHFHKTLEYSIIKSVIPNRITIPFKNNLFIILGKGVHEHVQKLYGNVGVKHVSFKNIL